MSKMGGEKKEISSQKEKPPAAAQPCSISAMSAACNLNSPYAHTSAASSRGNPCGFLLHS